MKPFLMGTETEYAVSGREPSGAVGAEEVFAVLNGGLRHERRWLPDAAGGWSAFLEHGGRFYLDSGGHPEYATPECLTPTQVAIYDKAGERLLEIARAHARKQRPDLAVTIAKNNVGAIHSDDATWGCHESYTCWERTDRVVEQMVPHIVSRLIYAGAGCLSGRPDCEGFELSQRARHLTKVFGTETTSNRPIFGTRIRKVADYDPNKWTRVHLIAKDSQRAPFGIYLTFGTTGLLFLLVNAGRTVGKGLALSDPVRAAQTIACDPWLRSKVPLADGRRLTALEIQTAYLEECEQALEIGDFPPWTDEVLRHWRQTLQELTQDPLRLADRLDPYCKLLIYGHELRREGYTWTELHSALASLTDLRKRYPADVVRALLAENPMNLSMEGRALHARAAIDARARLPGTLDRLRFAVRLQALELNYHELDGLHDRLAAAGQFRSVVLTRDEVEKATREPPTGGRAAVRSRFIKDCREEGWVCDWRYLYHGATKTFVDMRNPFAGEVKTERVESLGVKRREDLELMEMLEDLGDY